MNQKIMFATFIIVLLLAVSVTAVDLTLICPSSISTGETIDCDLSFTEEQSLLVLEGTLTIPSNFETVVTFSGLPTDSFEATYNPVDGKVTISDFSGLVGDITTQIATLTFTSVSTGENLKMNLTVDPAGTSDQEFEPIVFGSNSVESNLITISEPLQVCDPVENGVVGEYPACEITSCDPGFELNGAGDACVEEACEPVCAGKTCGDDGCGGTCGTCDPGNVCSDVGVCEDDGSQGISFPDQNLHNAVCAQLEKDDACEISKDEAEELPLLNGNSKQITNLEGISQLNGLNQLFLNTNSISDLTPLSGMTGLTLLWLSGNEINDLTPLSELTALTHLRLSSNTNVNSIGALSNLKLLETLYMTGLNLGQVEACCVIKQINEGGQLTDVKPDYQCDTVPDEACGLMPIQGITLTESDLLSNFDLLDFADLFSDDLLFGIGGLLREIMHPHVPEPKTDNYYIVYLNRENLVKNTHNVLNDEDKINLQKVSLVAFELKKYSDEGDGQ
jgi:hypothetical protein